MAFGETELSMSDRLDRDGHVIRARLPMGVRMPGVIPGFRRHSAVGFDKPSQRDRVKAAGAQYNAIVAGTQADG